MGAAQAASGRVNSTQVISTMKSSKSSTREQQYHRLKRVLEQGPRNTEPYIFHLNTGWRKPWGPTMRAAEMFLFVGKFMMHLAIYQFLILVGHRNTFPCTISTIYKKLWCVAGPLYSTYQPRKVLFIQCKMTFSL